MKHIPHIFSFFILQVITFIAAYYINMNLLHNVVNGASLFVYPLIATIVLPVALAALIVKLVKGHRPNWQLLTQLHVLALIIFIVLGAALTLLFWAEPTGA